MKSHANPQSNQSLPASGKKKIAEHTDGATTIVTNTDVKLQPELNGSGLP
jgi:hypothetical protein